MSAGSTRDQRALLRRNYLGFVFQGFNLLAAPRALENVELPLIYRGMSSAERRTRARAALAQVGLGGLRASHAGRALRRPAAARGDRARHRHRARVLLADEPTGNLDTDEGREIMELLRSSTASRAHHRDGHARAGHRRAVPTARSASATAAIEQRRPGREEAA